LLFPGLTIHAPRPKNTTGVNLLAGEAQPVIPVSRLLLRTLLSSFIVHCMPLSIYLDEFEWILVKFVYG